MKLIPYLYIVSTAVNLGLEMQTDWPDCYKKPPLIRKILMCIDQDVLQNPTVDKLIKHRNFVNLTRFSSESVISEMKKSLNIIKLSRNSSIELQKREFDSCIHQTRISAVFNYFKTDSTTQRSRNETASTKEINFKNPTETQRSVWQGIDTKLSLKIRNTNIYTSSSFHNILEQMVDNGKNVTCCYKPAMEHVNNATQRAQIELSQCFKNQSYEFQISIIIEISNIKIEKSFFDKCVQADILLNASSKENFVRCLDYDVTNKNVFQKFDAKVEAYMQSHRGLLENCLKIVMANYRDSVTHGYIKFDSCLENQKTKQCNPRIATNPDRSIQISLKNSFDDEYDWVLWNYGTLSWVPRLG